MSEKRKAMSKRISVRELAAVSPTTEIEVLNWLLLHDDENYLVDESCAVIYTDRPGGRNTRALRRTIEKLGHPAPRVLFVDAATFASVRELRRADDGEDQSDATRTEIARNMEQLLEEAIQSGASDVHIRIREREASLLFRIDGLLSMRQTYSRRVGLRLARFAFNYFARVRGDFNEKMPMDGAFEFRSGDENYGVRINLMPESRGCTLVMRLRAPQPPIDLREAGYAPHQERMIRGGLRRSSGLMIFSGPTNSGKSTSVCNLLAEVPMERSVISIEDPVEVRLPYVAHVDLSTQPEGVDLQELLACTVRQDPDILSLAEIRDDKTARYAENMALQGRFVISTLHADRVAAIPLRLGKLGMDDGNFYLPGFLNVLVNQTLIPRLCAHCALKSHADPKRHAYYRELLGGDGAIRYRDVNGCAECHAGISGRELVAEALPVDRQVRALFRKADYDAIADHMRKHRIISRHQHSRQKILAGLLDPEMVEARTEPFSAETLA